MQSVVRSYLTTGVAIAAAAVMAGPPAQLTAAGTASIDVALRTGEGPLSDVGSALTMGASFYANPSVGWAQAFNELYLKPLGYTGPAPLQVSTPESLYPFTLPFSMTYDNSTSQGLTDIERAIAGQLKADPGQSVVVTGYSQSSSIDTLLMQDLAKNGGVITGIKDAGGNPLPDIHASDLHFVMVGDPNNPNGGMLERFALPGPDSTPTATALGLTFSGATPSDVSPADVYTYEYDGFADFPRYPINFLSDINAYLGILFNHIGYLGLSSDQIADAVKLPVSDPNGLVNYFMVESPSLPLLDGLRLIPVIGNPLADLIQPDLKVLVDLGYGSVTNGWDPGFADVPTTLGFLPDLNVLMQVPGALINGLFKGIWDSANDWFHLGNYFPIAPQTWTDVLNPMLGTIGAGASLNTGSWDDFVNAADGFIKGAVNWFTQGLQEISLPHTGVPLIDMAETLMFTLPTIAFEIAESHLKDGDLLGAIGDPLAALVGLSPLMLIGAVL